MTTPHDQARHPWGTRLLGAVAEPPARRKHRVQWVLTTTVLVTHLIGVAGVVTLQWLLLPFDELTSGRFRTAALLVTPVAVLWAVGGAVTVGAYGLAEPAVVPVLATAVISCGALACGFGYLVAEISLRPLTAIAFKVGPAPARPYIGIRARLVGIWVVAIGLPMTGLVVLAVHAVGGSGVPASRLALILGFIGVGGMVVSIAAGWLLVTAMLAPIRSVSWEMEELAGGNPGARIDVFDATELGQLQRGFNDMADMVGERQRLRELFVLHVGGQVARAAELQEPRLGGEVTRVAVLFVDLVGSTALASTHPAAEVVELLNEFFEVVVDEVEAGGGFIDQFQGDAALAVFGAPAPRWSRRPARRRGGGRRASAWRCGAGPSPRSRPGPPRVAAPARPPDLPPSVVFLTRDSRRGATMGGTSRAHDPLRPDERKRGAGCRLARAEPPVWVRVRVLRRATTTRWSAADSSTLTGRSPSRVSTTSVTWQAPATG